MEKKYKGQLSQFFKNPRKLIQKKYLYEYLLCGIILLALFFRFYNTPARYGFDFDPTRDALVSQYGAEQLTFPLLGPKSGIAPFTFGPWYYYQLIGARLILPTDYSPWIYIGITSAITVLIAYFIGKKLEDKKFGLILALLMALSPAELGPITGLSNPNLIPIQASLSLLFFVYYFKQKLPWYFALFWGITIGIGINNHYQMVGLLILPLLAIVLRKISLRECALFACGLIISFIPLLYYNLTNDWQTIRGYIYFQRIGKYAVYTPNRWLFYIRDFWPGFWSYVIGVPLIVGFILLMYTGIIWMWAFWKRKLSSIYIVLLVAFGLNFVLLRYFAGPRENYYFIYLHLFILIFFGWAVWQSLKQKIFLIPGIIICAVVLFFVLKEDLSRLHSEERYLTYTAQAERIQNMFPGENFILYHCGKDDKNRTQAITYFLYRKHKIDENGIKIGIKSSECKPPAAKYYTSFEGYIFPEGFHNPDWKKITPQTVYEESVNWWKNQ